MGTAQVLSIRDGEVLMQNTGALKIQITMERFTSFFRFRLFGSKDM